MPRSFALILILFILVTGALFFFSSQAEEVPTSTVEIDTIKAADAR